MCQHNRAFSCVLLLLILAAGSLQAQILPICAGIKSTVSNIASHHVSDMELHGSGICNSHEECISADCSATFDSSQGLCCEESPIISTNQYLQQNIPILNSIVESDIDPPQATNVTYNFVFQKQIKLSFVAFLPFSFYSQSGSYIYFITRRLRI